MKSLLRIFLQGILVVGLLYLFSWHLRVGLNRYFDVDEFTYFHWVSLFTDGQKPYIDYFMFFPPLFLFVFAPLFWLLGKSVTVFIAGRMLALAITAGLFLAMSFLFGMVRNKRYALLVGCLLAFLPMPFDKFFEIRPDNLSTLFAILGMICQVLFLTTHQRKITAFLSGFFYFASLLVFPKTISFVAVAGLIWLIDCLPAVVTNNKPRQKLVLWFVWGALTIIGVVGLYLLTLGNLDQVWYALATLPFEANKTSTYIYEAHLFFFPSAAWYGADGISLGLLLNHTLWISGIMMGVYRLFTAILTASGDRRRMLAELLIAGIFLLNAVLYVSYYPMKHPQYLIPVGLFVGFYAADLLSVIFNRLQKIQPLIPIGIITVILLLFSYQTGIINSQKITWTNKVQLQQYEQLQQLIPNDYEVFDVEGRMISWPQPYTICCLAFGEYIHNISRRPPEVRDVLEAKKVPYLFQGDSRRIYVLPMADRVYIQSHYAVVQGWGDALWRRL